MLLLVERFIFWWWTLGFWKEGVKTYLMTLMSPLNSPTFFFHCRIHSLCTSMGSWNEGICNLIAKLIIAISKIFLHSYVTLHEQNLCKSLFVGVFLFAALNSCAHVTMRRTKTHAEGANRKGDDTRYAPRPVWVATCWRLCWWTSKMFTQITNLDRILHTHTCCECEQEISPNVD